jgi:hypothetical protein
MGPVKAGVVAGEGKADVSNRSRAVAETAVSFEAMSRSLAEKAGGGGAEKRNARSYCLRCSALSIPAAGKAGNPITWNHFF